MDSLVGYGNMAPHTELGKVIVIAYALIGIPLTFLMLQGLGQQLTHLSDKVNNLKLCSKRPDLNKYLNMVIIILIGVSLLFVGPTFLFMNVEGWRMMDAIYYCFVTLSTIGFGDFIPGIIVFLPIHNWTNLQSIFKGILDKPKELFYIKHNVSLTVFLYNTNMYRNKWSDYLELDDTLQCPGFFSVPISPTLINHCDSVDM
jgi:hypothetical protein